MILVRSDDIPFIPASHEDQANPEVWKKVLFKKADLSSGRVQMINWAKLPVGKSFRSHFHEDMDEIFIVIHGTVTIQVNDEKDMLQTGDAVLVPEKHIHKMTNDSLEDVLYIVIGITRDQGGKTVVTQ